MAIKDEEDAEVKASEFKKEDEVDDEKALKYEDNYEGSERGQSKNKFGKQCYIFTCGEATQVNGS